ncbi:MAG: hypothetical protein AB8G11_06965, partial [Saprospiraceae bacterium]
MVELPAQNIITEFEYWYNDSFDVRTNVTLTPPAQTLNLNYSEDVSSLNFGFHRLYYRFKDSNNNWSVPMLHVFYKLSTEINDTASFNRIIGYEYWIDGDFANRTKFNTPTSNNILLLNGNFDMSGISEGSHIIYLRFQDGRGNWSVPIYSNFQKPYFTNINIEICNGDFYNIGNSSYNQTGIYTDTLTSILSGGDSIVVSNLTVLPNSTENLIASICQGDSYEGYSTTGVYVDTLLASNG